MRICATRDGGHAHLLGQFLVGRLAPEDLLQFHGGAAHLGNLVHQMDGQPDGLGLVGQGALDGLLDPPRAVGGELAALGRVKPLHRLHQADVAFVDQIQQRQAEVLIVAGDLDHQAQIGLDHLLAGLFVALFDAGGQLDFLLRRQQLDLADFAQIKLDGGIAIVAGTLSLRYAA